VVESRIAHVCAGAALRGDAKSDENNLESFHSAIGFMDGLKMFLPWAMPHTSCYVLVPKRRNCAGKGEVGVSGERGGMLLVDYGKERSLDRHSLVSDRDVRLDQNPQTG
jgi:hypothetical protein